MKSGRRESWPANLWNALTPFYGRMGRTWDTNLWRFIMQFKSLYFIVGRRLLIRLWRFGDLICSIVLLLSLDYSFVPFFCFIYLIVISGSRVCSSPMQKFSWSLPGPFQRFWKNLLKSSLRNWTKMLTLDLVSYGNATSVVGSTLRFWVFH